MGSKQTLFRRQTLMNIAQRLNIVMGRTSKFYDHIRSAKQASYERYGMDIIQPGLLQQHLHYLRGLQCEMQENNQAIAKKHYLNALTLMDESFSPPVNHRIRKETLQRLLDINTFLGVSVNPERVLLSSYVINQKHVQVLIDMSSFTHARSLQAMMKLPMVVFESMNLNDSFGLRTLNCTLDHEIYGHNKRVEQVAEAEENYVTRMTEYETMRHKAEARHKK